MTALHLNVLAPPQRRFWERLAPRVPDNWVLYGGTAIALRYGHRKSVDFDFFTDQPLRERELRKVLPTLEGATVLEHDLHTLVVSLAMARKPIKLSFFAGLKFGRVASPERFDNGRWIASPLDLLATKLKTLHDRVEARDYQDIEILLRQGDVTLASGIAAARALFGTSLNPLDTAKAVGWFADGDLMRQLPLKTQRFLVEAAAQFQPGSKKVAVKARTLVPGY